MLSLFIMAHWGLFTAERVVTDTPVELTGLATVIALGVGAYRKIECHQHGCHRLGRFTHGHLKLCHVHHPLTPDNGKITAVHIAAVKAKAPARKAPPRP